MGDYTITGQRIAVVAAATSHSVDSSNSSYSVVGAEIESACSVAAAAAVVLDLVIANGNVYLY